MLDAGIRAIQLLKTQPIERTRVLLFIGQPFDRGSATPLETLRLQAQAANVVIYSLALPIAGKKFVSDTFRFPSMTGQKGGVEVGAELTSLIPGASPRCEEPGWPGPFLSAHSCNRGHSDSLP
jgi:hypothetical protein